MKFFDTKYRITTARGYFAFQPEYRPWWWPFWMECDGEVRLKFGGDRDYSSRGGNGMSFCQTAHDAKGIISAHQQARGFRKEVVWADDETR